MISGASWAVSTPWCRGVPSTTVGNVVIRWQELITVTSSFACADVALRHEAVAHRAEDLGGEPALDRGLERAVARRVNGQEGGGRVGSCGVTLTLRRACDPRSGSERAAERSPRLSGCPPQAAPRSRWRSADLRQRLCSTRNVFSRTSLTRGLDPHLVAVAYRRGEARAGLTMGTPTIRVPRKGSGQGSPDGLEQRLGAQVEPLEEARVEHDAGRIGARSSAPSP